MRLNSNSYKLAAMFLSAIISLSMHSCKKDKPLYDIHGSENSTNNSESSTSNSEQPDQTDNTGFVNGTSTDDIESEVPDGVVNYFKKTGIKATIRGEGKTIVFIYDDEHRALKMQTAQAPSDTYMDENGYMYSYNSKQGWVKINLGGMMNKLPMMSDFKEFGFEGIDGGADSSNFFFPIVEWAMRFKTNAFERKEKDKKRKFVKRSIDCGKPQPCHKYVGKAGQAIGSYAIFDPSGKLKELNFKGNSINYEYGDYNVQLPDAQEISLGM